MRGEKKIITPPPTLHSLLYPCGLVAMSGGEFGSSYHRVIPFMEEKRSAFTHPLPPTMVFLVCSLLGLHAGFLEILAACKDIVENSAKNHFQTWSLLVCASLPQCMCSSVCLCMLAPVLCSVMHLLMWFDRLKCQYTISVCVCAHTSVVMNELSFLFYLDKEQPLLCLDVSIWKQDDHIQNGFAKR